MRLHTLDFLRGIAAILVIIFHLTGAKLAPTLLPHGYLAVDFFFILSGIVIALAYEKNLMSGMSFSTFLKARIIRLYPLACAGALLGLGVLLLKYKVSPEKVSDLSTILISGALNTLLLPAFLGSPNIYPGNGPLWSLFFEVVINVVWALFLLRAKDKTLWLVTLISGAMYAMAIVYHGTADIGFNAPTFLLGFPRVTFGFVLGVLLYRIRIKSKPYSIKISPWLLALALVVLFSAPHSYILDLIFIYIALPCIAYLGSDPDQQKFRIGSFLGDISYPAYALHIPILFIASGLRQSKFPTLNPLMTGIPTVVAVMVIAWAALKFFDEPVRRALYIKLLKAK